MAAIIFPEGYSFFFSNVKQASEPMHSNHYHEEIEIFYMVSGRCNYFIDDKIYEIVPGDLVLIPENVIHKTNYGEGEHARMVIEISRHFVPRSVLKAISGRAHIFRNPGVSREVYSLFKKIDDEHKNTDEHSSAAVQVFLTEILLILARNMNGAEKSEEKNAMIEGVVSYIKENYSQDITLSLVSKLHFISPEHLSRTFKKETGFGFNEFLALVRLQHAERLLKESPTMSISEIAYSCGFNDSNYFSDKFKKTYGISPVKYRKENR